MRAIAAVLLLSVTLMAQDAGPLETAIDSGNAEQVRAALDEVLARTPDAALRDRLLTRCTQRAAAHGTGFSLLLALAGLADDPVLLYHRAGLALQLKQLRRADQALQRLASRDPDGPLVLARRAELAYLRFDHRAAGALAARAGERNAAWARLQTRLADALDAARVRQWGVLVSLALVFALAAWRWLPGKRS